MNRLFTQNEEALLEEIDRFARYCIENNKKTDITLTPKQYNIFITICNRTNENKVVDRMNRIRNLNTEKETYNGFRIISMKSGKRYSKKDLGELFP